MRCLGLVLSLAFGINSGSLFSDDFCEYPLTSNAFDFYESDPLHFDIKRLLDFDIKHTEFSVRLNRLNWGRISPFHQKIILKDWTAKVSASLKSQIPKRDLIGMFINFIQKHTDSKFYPLLKLISDRDYELSNNSSLKWRTKNLLKSIENYNFRILRSIIKFENHENFRKRMELFSRFDWGILSDDEKDKFISWVLNIDPLQTYNQYDVEGLLQVFNKFRDTRFLNVLDYWQRQFIKRGSDSENAKALIEIRRLNFVISNSIEPIETRPLGETQILDLLNSTHGFAERVKRSAKNNNIIYTDHALRRMSERRISRDKVQEAFVDKKAHYSLQGYDPGRDSVVIKLSLWQEILQTRPVLHKKKSRLFIIFNISPITGLIVVISAFYDNQNSRYSLSLVD
ncbi:MAG: DUF4258 domain-containing protein [Proteobacteria bacterium]|nr:DUF4258 domain-containing protein [Pseudomonadota bacterium]